MRFQVMGRAGEVEIVGITPSGLPALRLVQYHSPQVSLACRDGSIVALGEIDLAPSFSSRDPSNGNHEQLAKTGG